MHNLPHWSNMESIKSVSHMSLFMDWKQFFYLYLISDLLSRWTYNGSSSDIISRNYHSWLIALRGLIFFENINKTSGTGRNPLEWTPRFGLEREESKMTRRLKAAAMYPLVLRLPVFQQAGHTGVQLPSISLVNLFCKTAQCGTWCASQAGLWQLADICTAPQAVCLLAKHLGDIFNWRTAKALITPVYCNSAFYF